MAKHPLYADIALRARLLKAAKSEKARRSFADFFQQGFHVVEGSTILEWTPALKGICDDLQALFEGWLVANGRGTAAMRDRVIAHWTRHGLTFEEGQVLVQNEIFNLAPGTLKSTIAMVFGPAWVWLHDPSVKFGCSSSNDDNVKRDSNAHRDLVTSSWYRSNFGIAWKIKGSADAVGRWSTTAGGLRISRTLLAGFIGIHVDIFLVDDPDDAQKVWNEPARKQVQGQFSRALENRVNHEKRSLRIIIQQRVHVDDLSGYLRSLLKWSPENRQGWASFVVPMRFGFGPKDLEDETPFGYRDWRTVKGELMHPSRFDEQSLADKITKLGSHGVAAQYDQNPEVVDGGMFPRALWRFFRVADTLLGQPGFHPSQEEADPRPRPEGCIGSDAQPGGPFGTRAEHPPYVLERNKDGTLKLDFLCISVDSTFGSLDAKTASNVGLLVIGGQGARRFVFHDATKMRTFKQTCDAIKAILLLFPAKRIIIENKANGSSVIETLRDDVADQKVIGTNGKPVIVVVEGVETGGDSYIGRANAMQPAVEAGLWYLLDGAHWLAEFLAEVCVFPNGKRDDRVDAMSQAATYYSDNNEAMKRAMALARW